ncbi:BREX system P-loop protein BrxC [Alicyclobacillus mengziensis]|uniref:BREX system P-loop protein BrxC n=1 Tax=Alicyclobacillus mengziensis TaxID=2931921 RepID=A0A9X7W0D3_9BACL|nr:BREX system P-loop protein BrxC [Alicyclobacillus mengziensis]QSO48381.1 BREX system P-loop protein BrxC [Alicyclobacillus mengziensis]
MKIQEMFEKDIERSIKGVIKVAQTDDENKYQELDEYVVTRELVKHFSKFYDNYQKGIDGATDKMGVWISGFFGSGKSHFLKILSYLLENKGINGKKAVDFFKDKIQDPLILANMARTANVETEVILFNIDSKSPLDNKSREDAILRVFLKVFYEHQGFYGDIPGVAEMEKYLTKEGVYDDFKREFKTLSGEEWVARRNTFYFDADYVIGALTKVTSMSEETARNWFDNGVNNFEISIEKFAREVKDYVNQKGDNFHLIFLVDEIGQYIGDSRQLMLNLQTLAEDLGTQCKGKVWIMVTAQESIDSIIKVKGDDFSRIQGRFDTRLSLSSVSVDEVIKKRILLKKRHATDMLELLYHEKSATLKNLISFKDATADFIGFSDEREFAGVYPFLPYQFKLVQNVFEQVRKHGSSGKNLSEGERSMLSAFQESGLRFKDEDEGALIPFYAFYDTIKEFLNPSIVRVIEGAYVNPSLKDDEFNANVLKTLFLIKYIKELPANIDNIATLMVTSIDADKLALKEKIMASLRKLIRETLIQQNGEIFEFLTDDEQDVNREIKATKVEEDLVKKELADLIFDDLYEGNRYRYSSQYTFQFNQKMDEKNRGSQTSTIGINILSPKSEHYEKSDQELMLMCSGSSEMILKLGANGSYTDEMEEVLQIKEYLRKKNPAQLPENIQNILNTKQGEARIRQRRVREMLEDAIKDGEFFINGNKLEVKGSTVKDKINTAFHELVDNVYTKLGLVKRFLDSDKDLSSLLKSNSTQITLEGSKSNENVLAIKEVYEFISLQSAKGQVRVKMILDRFSDKPYGWKQLDTAGLIAELLKDQRIRLRYNSEYLEPEDQNTLTALTKNSEVDKVIVLKRVKVDDALLKTARNICKEVFNRTDVADDEDGLLKDIRQLIDDQVGEINTLKSKYQGRKYPGLSLLNKGLEYFGEFTKGLDSVSFFTKLRDLEDNLLDWEEDVSYVKSFFEHQKDHFDNGLRAYERYSENKVYLVGMPIGDTAKKLEAILNDPVPYNRVKDIPELVNAIDVQIQTVLEEKKSAAKDTIQQDFDYLSLRASQDGVSDETKNRIQSYYEDLFKTIDSYVDIFKVDASIMQSANFKTAQDKVIDHETADIPDGPDGPEEREPIHLKEKVKVGNLLAVRTLRTEEDVDKLLGNVSAKLKQILKGNKEVELVD